MWSCWPVHFLPLLVMYESNLHHDQTFEGIWNVELSSQTVLVLVIENRTQGFEGMIYLNDLRMAATIPGTPAILSRKRILALCFSSSRMRRYVRLRSSAEFKSETSEAKSWLTSTVVVSYIYIYKQTNIIKSIESVPYSIFRFLQTYTTETSKLPTRNEIQSSSLDHSHHWTCLSHLLKWFTTVFLMFDWMFVSCSSIESESYQFN